MSIRAQAVKKAKLQGLCTSCLKNKAAAHRYQCQRCIDTNRKKWRRVQPMGTKPQGMNAKEFANIEQKRRNKRDEKRKKNADYARARYHKQQAEKGKSVNHRKELSEEGKQRIRAGIAQAKARREALGSKDTGGEVVIRTYRKRVQIASLPMAGMINDLERFIGNLPTMSATDYLEAREALIMSIIKRGRNVDGYNA